MQTASDQATARPSAQAQAPALSPVALRLLALPDRPPPPVPYTHARHAAACGAAAADRRTLVAYVQVRLDHATHCARIIEAWTPDGGPDLWKLQTLSPIASIRSALAARCVQCSGIDGRCVCAGEGGQQ